MVEPVAASGLGAKSDCVDALVVVVSSVFLVRLGRRSFFGLGAFVSPAGVTSIGIAVAAGTVSVLVEAAGTFEFDGGVAAGDCVEVGCPFDVEPAGLEIG